ncbi:NmrA-like protein [Tolypocladium paradoxum]|uniref:NmrA-like protein n=1 Tax=Tolypocladium paradoxum TaxID=94208 RepID=A0A2S4KTP0_9HYPO|nr:NmrA-like protein [Tolypocladium paradoxum]
MLFIAASKAGQRLPQHQRAIEAAKKAGVSHIVYTSFIGVDVPDHPALVVQEHKATEAMIRGSGLRWTMLRDAQYAEAISDVAAPTALKCGKLQSNSGDGRMAFISRNDCVASAIAVLTNPAVHRDKVYHITGPELLNWTDVAHIISSVTGRDIKYEEQSDEEQFAIFDRMGIPRVATDDSIVAGHPWHSTDMVSFARAMRLGHMAFISNDVMKLTGQKPRSLREVVEERLRL